MGFEVFVGGGWVVRTRMRDEIDGGDDLGDVVQGYCPK